MCLREFDVIIDRRCDSTLDSSADRTSVFVLRQEAVVRHRKCFCRLGAGMSAELLSGGGAAVGGAWEASNNMAGNSMTSKQRLDPSVIGLSVVMLTYDKRGLTVSHDALKREVFMLTLF